MKMLEYIVNYFRGTKHYSVLRFVFEMSAFAIILQIIVGLTFYLSFEKLGVSTSVGYQQNLPQYVQNLFVWVLFGDVLLVPFIETFLQYFLVYITSKFTNNVYYLIFIPAVIFVLSHRVPILIVTLFPIAIILTWGIIVFKRQSFWKSILVVFSIHMIHNLFSVILLRYAI